MAPNRRNLMVGLVVLTAMIGMGWMILKLASNSITVFARGARFELIANRADGVAEGSPVLYLGVNVGRVLSVQRNADNDSVAIEATLDTGQQIPINVVGNIKAQSALGSSAEINLEPQGPPAHEYIASGSTIKAHFAGGGLVPPEVVSIATQVSEQQLVRHVDQTVISMRQQLEKAGKLLDSASEMVNDPQVRASVKGTISDVHKASENLERFSGHLDELAAQTTDTIKQVRTSVADGSVKLDALSRQLDERMQQLAVVLDKVQSIASKIDNGKGTAGLLVNDPRLYESLNDTSRDLDMTFKGTQRLVEQWEQEGFSLRLK